MSSTANPPYAPWIADLPAGWSVGNIGRMAYLKARVGWQNLRSDEFVDEGPYCVTGTDFRDGRIHWEGCYHVSETRYAVDPYIQLRDGDLLVTKDGTIGKLAIVDAMRGPATLNSGVFVVRPLNSSFDTRYLYWVLVSGLFTNFVSYMADGTTINHLYQNVFVRFPFPLPPRQVQLKIARFLDERTAHLDTLIEKKRRLLALLEEKRVAVITHAVTKGLGPNVPMKDSGVDWLGEIPAHWEVKRVKFLISLITSGSRGWAEYYSDEGATFLQSGNLGNKMQLDFGFVQHVTPPDGAEGRRTAVSVDDVLVCITGARTGAVAHVSGDLGEAYINQHVALLRPTEGKVFPRFLAYALWSNLGREQLWLSSYGMKEGLGLQHVLSVMLTSPTIDEQVAIVRHLDDQQRVLDRLSSTIQAAMDRLTEYRSALITNAVTGKIDVRGEVAKEAAA